MKRIAIIFSLSFVSIATIQCSLTEKLAKAKDKIATIKKNIVAGKGEVMDKCNSTGGCSVGTNCKNG